METFSIEAPSLYADHHVSEVRRLLLELPGVEEVNASSAFQVIEVYFDPTQTSSVALKARLEDAGYLGELESPQENSVPTVNRESRVSFLRHTAAIETGLKSIGFKQKTHSSRRPLWPCPGMGVINNSVEEETRG